MLKNKNIPMKKIYIIPFFFLYITNIQIKASNMDLVINKDATRANGTDMQNPKNIMFEHSLNIYPNDNPAIRYFQANDGSMNNGVYNKTTGNASTDLHIYSDVILINGTKQTPKLNDKNQYKDQKGNLLESVGIFNEYNENDGESQMYYLFGKIALKKENKDIQTNLIQNNAQPKIDFYSYSADNDGYPGIN